jgi:hypothetical protein
LGRGLLIEPDENITANPSSKVDLGLEVKLDADHEGGVLELAVAADRALEEVAFSSTSKLALAWSYLLFGPREGVVGRAGKPGRIRKLRLTDGAVGLAGQSGHRQRVVSALVVEGVVDAPAAEARVTVGLHLLLGTAPFVISH